MENHCDDYHNNQDPDDFYRKKLSNDRLRFIKKMIVLATSIISVPMVIFIIIFAVIWHDISDSFDRQHKEFQAASKQWDKNFWERANAIHAMIEKDGKDFQKNMEESEKKFHEIGEHMDKDRGKDYTDDEWEAMEDGFFDHKHLDKIEEKRKLNLPLSRSLKASHEIPNPKSHSNSL